ncbi:sugar transferase [Geobacillus thermocatenulatus]|uniref:sugar transferase n=1 Tax=Geobacillus thermocatenulatus TaxID=33938 RepID=UPI003D1F7ED5
MIEEELKSYKMGVLKFLSVKPRITGYWKVSEKREVRYLKRVDVELFYVYNQSLFLDIVILVKTVFMVLLRKGAY